MVPCRSAELTYYERFVTFLSHSNFANLNSRKRCNWTPRGRMYCARRPLACYVHDTRFAWAVRVAYFYWGQRRSEYGVSQCGNPRFLWLSTTTTRETSPCPTTERSPSSPHASSRPPPRSKPSAGPKRVAQPLISC